MLLLVHIQVVEFVKLHPSLISSTYLLGNLTGQEQMKPFLICS